MRKFKPARAPITREIVTHETYPLPGLYGWAATFAVVGAFDLWAAHNKRPTMSRTLGHYLAHPVLGPLLAGGWCMLSFHLLIEELLPGMIEEAAK